MLKKISVAEIAPHPFNAQYFHDLSDDELEDLAQSIAEHGMIQYPVVCNDGNGGYILLCGHQRLRAARHLGLTEITVDVRDNIMPDSPEAEIMLISENLHRRQLSHTEIRKATMRLAELGMSKQQIAEKLNISRVSLYHIINSQETTYEVIPELRNLMPDLIHTLKNVPVDAQRVLLEHVTKIQTRSNEEREKLFREQLEQKIKSLTEQSKEHLRRALEAERQLKTTENILSKKKQSIEEMTQQIAELQAQLQELHIQTNQSHSNEEEIEELKQQLEQLTLQLQNERQQKLSVENTLAQLERQYQHAMETAKHEMNQAILRAQRETEESIAKIREDADRKIREAESQNLELKERNEYLQHELEKLENEIQQITKKPIPVAITQYLSSCLTADRMAEIFAGQLREILVTISGKSRQDPDSFQSIPAGHVSIWITRLQTVADLCHSLIDNFKRWHQI